MFSTPHPAAAQNAFFAAALLAGFAAPNSAAAAQPPLEASIDASIAADDEREDTIEQLPNLPGDKESQRRALIKEAWKFSRKSDRFKQDSPEQRENITQAYRLIFAADKIRSTTFTRCNLGMMSILLDQPIRAAEHFEREQQNPFPPPSKQADHELRDTCDFHYAEALTRVGRLRISAPPSSDVWVDTRMVGKAPVLGSVFVEPDRDHVVRIKLDSERELREVVSVGAGESTTLEFHSPEFSKKIEPPEMKPETQLPLLPRRPDQVPIRLNQGTQGQDEQWRIGLKWGGFALTGAGAMLGVGAALWQWQAQSALGSTIDASTGLSCRNMPETARDCVPIHKEIGVTNALLYTSVGMAFLGAVGLGFSFLYPQDTASGFRGQNAQWIPSGVQFHGRW